MTGGRSWPFWAMVVLLILVDLTLHLGLGLGREAPDLITIAALLAARRLSGAGAAALGVGLGLLRDSLSIVAFGADAIALGLVSYLASRTRDLFIGDTLPFFAVYLLLGKWVHDALYLLIRGSVTGGNWMQRLLTEAPIAALYAAAAGVVVILAYRLMRGSA